MAFGEDVKPKSREQILKEKRAKEKEKEAINIDRFDESEFWDAKTNSLYFLRYNSLACIILFV